MTATVSELRANPQGASPSGWWRKAARTRPCACRRWAGPANDSEGQQLLAEALRIDPGAESPKMAFERMEAHGRGTTPSSIRAITQFRQQELAEARSRDARPSFRRAQMGFNNNIKSKGADLPRPNRRQRAHSTRRTSSPTSSPTVAGSSRATSAPTRRRCRARTSRLTCAA